MARKKKADDTPQIQIPPHLRVPLYAVFAVLAISAGLGILWQVWLDYASDELKPKMAALRENLARNVESHATDLRTRLDELMAGAELRAEVAAGENDKAIERTRAAWPELSGIELHDARLDDAFSQDLKAQGFGKLALLSSAANQGKAVVGVVGSGGSIQIGISAPIFDTQAPDDTHPARLAVLYALLPLAQLAEPVRNAALPGGYVELRSGATVLLARGDARLQHKAETTPVGSGDLAVATAAPQFATTLSYSPGTQAVMAAVLLALGGVLLLKLRQALRTGSTAPGEEDVTFGAALRQLEPATEATPRAPIAKKGKPSAEASHVDPSIFRAYDIRGVVGKTLDASIARLIGQAIGSLMAENGLNDVVVGRDGRLSGPELSNALIEGLRLAGRDVTDIGMAPTPMVYFGAFHLNAGSCVAVTGSHNPPDYNGFKIVVGGETLSGAAIRDLYARIADGRLEHAGGGNIQTVDIANDYLSQISGDVQIERPLKVVVDAGNGVAGMIAPQVLESIGAEVVPLYCEVDGDFPNHHPDPSEPENLHDLIHFVQKFNADLGLAFDGDGDRLGVVTKQGEVIFPDRLLMLFARDVLSRNPGATVIYDVKCTGHLAGQILRNGGSPIMWKTGHSLIKAKMKETEAELAGEMSGHFFFRERWFGFDDGIYSAARLLEILAADERAPEEVFDELPKGVSTPEIKVPTAEGEHYDFVERFVAQARFEGAKLATIDGIRADWNDGWGLVRCSNTTPCLVLRFDADSETALERIKATFREQMLAVKPELELPF